MRETEGDREIEREREREDRQREREGIATFEENINQKAKFAYHSIKVKLVFS